jgi:F-type H+-transporting ATPase subunit epsilon
MADPTFTLAILTPSREEFAGPVTSLVVPGIAGYLGVLAHHAPLITPLAAGHLEMRFPDGRTALYYVSGGFLEVSRNKAIVLADSLEPAGEIDPGAAEGAVRAAREARREATAPIPVAEAEQALARARARLRTARKQRGELN